MNKLSYDYKKNTFPKDWNQIQIKDVLELVARPIKMEDNDEYELVTVRRGFNGIDSRGRLLGKNILVKSQFEINKGDFLISKRQISHGACGIVPESLDKAIVSNEYNAFLPKENVDLEFINLYVQLPFMRRNFYVSSDGIHIEKLLFKTSDWMKKKICLPEYDEQRKIAEILNTKELEIMLKERVLIEKQKYKKELMKKLLSQSLRLESFNEKWKSVKLEKIADITKGYQVNKLDMIKDGKYKVMNGGMTESGYTDKWNADKNTITISEGGNSCGFVNFIREKFWCGGHCYIVNPISSEIEKDFLYQILKYNELNIMNLRVGSGLPNIQKKSISNLFIDIPCVEEQYKIAEILKVADKETYLLQKEIELLKEQKKGLMQLLLTGIVRVNVE